MEINGTAAIVTGGSGGLGRMICTGLARAGADVAVVYGESCEVAETVVAAVKALGRRAIAVQANVADEAEVRRAVEQTVAAFGRVDILVNDAAYNKMVPYKDLDGLTLDLWQKMLAINTTGPFLFMKAVAPVMLKQQRGRIVNISSVAGLAPTGSSIAYAVSKAALIHLTKCMAVALAPHVLVNAIAPATMEGTKMTANLDPAYVARGLQNTLTGRVTDKEDVVEQVLTFARSESTTGQTLVIDGGRVFH
ncbi:MAG: SDR family NAD(P)-dependent oxidoreductase [Chloroflexota bacterium]